MPQRKTLLSAIPFIAILLPLCFLARDGNEAVASLQPTPDLKSAKFFGAQYCQTCHEKPLPAFQKSADFVLLTEFATWKEKDKHSQAFEVLKGEHSQAIGRRLGYDVTKDARCLNCHTMHFPEDRRGDSFRIEDGVSCDGCHGPAEHWITPHSQQAWRKKTADEKSKLGMIDVRNPVTRSKLCLSCHLGNMSEEKYVTHDMYAAGHPPLPSFETATFSEHLPRHWRLSREVPFLQQAAPEVRKQYHFDPEINEQARLVLIGGILNLRESARLFADRSDRTKKLQWPEFAQFDCAACHHDLKSPSWRQQRGYVGKPGRPGPRLWPLALAKLAFPPANNDSRNYETTLLSFHKAFDAQPFGNPADIANASSELIRQCDGILKRLEQHSFNHQSAHDLLIRVSSIGSTEHMDYDSARQLAWAFRTIYGEQIPKPTKDADIVKQLDLLDKDLLLTLPSGTGKNILQELPRSLQSRSNYDSDMFRKQMQKLNDLLK